MTTQTQGQPQRQRQAHGPRYTAVIFDMDGLLVDSEPLWHRAEIEVFATFGLRLEPADCLRTTGLRINEVVDFWKTRAAPDLAIRSASTNQIAEAIVTRVIELVHAEGTLLPGARAALDLCAALKPPIALGLASSSDLRLIQAVLDRFALRSYFQVVHSAEKEPFGKPHPAVYISTARLLGLLPQACLAIEDSLNGLIAAKAARMDCVVVPALADRTGPDARRFGLADAILASLTEFNADLWDRLAASTS